MIRRALPLMCLSAATACRALFAVDDLAGGAGPDGTMATDGSAGDAASNTDDAGPNVQIDGGPFCTGLLPAPVFCDDFEDPTSLEAVWTTTTKKGTVTKAGGELLVKADAVGSADESAAFVRRFAARPATAELSFRMFVEELSASSSASMHVGGVSLETGSKLYEVEVTVESTSVMRIDEYAKPGSGGAPDSFSTARFNAASVGEWRHVRLELAFEGTPRARLWLDGSPTPNAEKALTPTVLEPTLAFGVGVTYTSGPKPAGSVRYDDVVFRAIP